MLVRALTGVSVLALIAASLVVAQEKPTVSASGRQLNATAAAQSASSALSTPAGTTPQAPAEPKGDKAGASAATEPKSVLTPKQEAWKILDTACKGDKVSNRATAIRVLGLVPNDARARKLAEDALKDDKFEVRTAAATALGDMNARASIPKLKEALDDKEASVALAAAHALNLMHDDSAYEVYYEILSGDRKASRGLIASEAAVLKDKKKMAELGFEEGIGFIPFAGIGWGAFKTITKDDTSPVRAAAAKVLAKDPDPATSKALDQAAGDKNWLVRAAALEALAKRGNPEALDTVARYMSDDKVAVKYTAAAAVLHLTRIKESRPRTRAMKKQAG